MHSFPLRGNGSLLRIVGASLPAVMLLHVSALPADAHKLFVFAQVQGTTIEGRAYFPGDVPSKDTDIIVRDPSGRELGRTKTGDEGKFTFAPRYRIDHQVSAETADGHEGHFTVHAAELPEGLPDEPITAASNSTAARPGETSPAGSSGSGSPSAANEQVAELTRQIGALREQVFQNEERLRFRDILGGIGFILGLTGVAFYLKAGQKRGV
jgi:nickel transport protein